MMNKNTVYTLLIFTIVLGTAIPGVTDDIEEIPQLVCLPSTANYYYYLGLGYYHRENNYVMAQYYFDKALEDCPSFSVSHFTNGSPVETITILNKQYEICEYESYNLLPDFRNIILSRMALANDYMQLHNYEIANKLYNQVLLLDPFNEYAGRMIRETIPDNEPSLNPEQFYELLQDQNTQLQNSFELMLEYKSMVETSLENNDMLSAQEYLNKIEEEIIGINTFISSQEDSIAIPIQTREITNLTEPIVTEHQTMYRRDGSIEGQLGESGYIQIQLSWPFDLEVDMDLAVIIPSGVRVYYANPLDVASGFEMDIEHYGQQTTGQENGNFIENIHSGNNPMSGVYKVIVSSNDSANGTEIPIMLEINIGNETFSIQRTFSSSNEAVTMFIFQLD